MLIWVTSVLIVFFIAWVLFFMLGAGVYVSSNPCSLLLGCVGLDVLVDSTSVVCVSMLGICSLLAFVFCFHYYHESSEGLNLFYLMLWFVCVMFVLVLSGSLVFSLIMWEYLGFVSFLLILFYSNSSSVQASLITLFCSRFGDVGLFVLIACFANLSVNSVIFFFFFLMVVITKSAGFPFISWLLEAMRAPTPVSSLVHSSTLVAAGVWFLVRYGDMSSYSIMFFLFVVSLVTIVISGLCAVFFLDLKKVVALSTCNNISWCVLYYSCGDPFMVVFQLIVHGVSKCLLFILVGDLMSGSGGSQSSVGLYLSRYYGVLYCSLVVVLVLGLCGAPFLGIYFSKHCFFSWLSNGVANIVVFSLILIGFVLSFIYSFRLVLVICSKFRGISAGFLTSFLFGLFFLVSGSFIGIYMNGWQEEIVLLSSFNSIMFLFLQFVGCYVGYLIFISDFNGTFWKAVLFGNDLVVKLFYMWFSKVSSIFEVGVYRVEVWFLSLLCRGITLTGGVSSLVLTLNFVVVGLVFFVIVAFIL